MNEEDKYNKIQKNLPQATQSIFNELRKFCLSLGNNVIEDIRTHRIVFCKSINFRWFVDIKPDSGKLFIRIQKNRKMNRIFDSDYNIEEIKKSIQDAYDNIR
ncbi:MAG: hypothetical protein KAF24_02695 [Nitrosopumilaceae archaeon]|nr:hypothetical protein [Nitrosopumilaceae archaeon]